MELRSLLSDPSSHPAASEPNKSNPTPQHPHSPFAEQNITPMSSVSPPKHLVHKDGYSTPPDMAVAVDGPVNSPLQQASPMSPSPKHVAFELLLDENSKVRARIPMRVQIFPHDTTDSIVTTVKNFYGIYEGAASGVSFEDENGNTLIARYENLRNNMTVYVRVIPGHTYPDNYAHAQPAYYGMSHLDGPKRPSLGEPFQMPPPQSAHGTEYGRPPSRPTSRVSRKRSTSPSGRGRRSASAQKAPSRSGIKSRGSSTHGSFHEDAMANYSDSDGGHGSVTSKKARSEQFASSEISMENILLDTRRKRPKFESSELPLFVPPQVPLTVSTSSISPQRYSTVQEGPSPFARPAQRAYNAQPLPSPQSYSNHDQLYGLHTPVMYPSPAVPHHGHRLRDRTNAQSVGRFGNGASRSNSNGILPTPDPTIASCISDEDVAMQLIRLGDASNFSHGRTSASTLDDAFSGIADASSSAGGTTDGEVSEGDEDLLPRYRQKLESSPMLPPGMIKKKYKNLDEILPSCESSDPSSDDADIDYPQEKVQTGIKSDEADPTYDEHVAKAKRPKLKSNNSTTSRASSKTQPATKANKVTKSRPTSISRKSKAPSVNNSQKAMPAPAQPLTTPAPSRKASSSAVNFQHQLGVDEEDLSTKPRCQRCRKSKKGCDRQRPCGRCKDAGIGIEGCLSEDEGNGRKGRYGRHMGVPVKKGPFESGPEIEEAQRAVPPLPIAAATAYTATDKAKKRKR
ncbi:hypothetical protein AJ80_09043 [Polytolypa hystricis UAMH7299]|uniref:Zn(2)-C6 fungal-type domain-containing protein n=1 Tax=Polytolypa hystricis (strain UAMH7299) TaxID=1447883 RepID=A0A2B7WXE2_POLH7|nr:hypothetical protein AJ80_09043 [Polytolypa hystricis UAMH7299]